MASDNENLPLLPTILLLIAAFTGFIISNSPYAASLTNLLATKLGFYFGSFEVINKSLLHLINDGLMAVFFLFIGLELKREIMVGELSDVKKATLPIFSALGGMIVPALIYLAFNFGNETQSGWGIPMATDIAFALGIMTILGSKVPSTLKILLAAIAIVDDLGAILVIAFFYTQQIGTFYLLMAAIFFALCLFLNTRGVTRLSIYMALGLPLWYFMLKSGIHATIAGVMLAACIPLAHKNQSTAKVIDDIFNMQASPLDSPAVFLEKSLLKWVQFLILPIFALANTNIALNSVSFGAVSAGIIFGLVIGKPLGVVGFTWVAAKLKLVVKPDNITWKQLTGLGFLAGIGFTMSLFIGSLAFTNPLFFNEAKLAILIASTFAAMTGIVLLSMKKKT